MKVKPPSNMLFLVWGDYYRRPDELGKAIGADVFYIKGVINSRGLVWLLFFWLDYSVKLFRSLQRLLVNRPTVVISQSPPVLCSAICWLYCRVFKARFIIDAHNSTFEKPWRDFPFAKYLLRSADSVWVHNDELTAKLESENSSIEWVTVPDVLPEFNGISRDSTSSRSDHILVVCSWDADEPLEFLFQSISNFLAKDTSGLQFLVTGNFSKNTNLKERHESDRFVFLGFVSELDYVDRLKNAMAVISVSDRDFVQQCATIEAMSVGVPVLTAGSSTSRRIFFAGAVLPENSVSGYEEGLEELTRNAESLASDMKNVRAHWLEEQEKRLSQLNLS